MQRTMRAERLGGGWVLAGGLLFFMVLGMAILASPVVALLGDGANAFAAAIHGLMAFLLMITATIGLYQGYRLFRDELEDLHDVLLPSVVNATLALLTIVFGNWIYIAYRAPGGPREYFMNTNPEVHKIFFEFKEYIALFALPLAVGAAFILLYYRSDVLRRPWLRYSVSVLLALVFFATMVAFGLGAAITKLQAA
jgi:cytochrome bd-type quinol oxidase subunit 1